MRLLALLLPLWIGASAPALAAKSAFVVGIDRYAQLKPEAQLERPSADAEAVGRTLETLGFAVTLMTRSVTQEEWLRRFSTFLAKVEPGDTVLVYFAGHGIALDNTNYLLPSDIPALEAGQELLVRTRALAETDLRAAVRERGARVVVMVIDACRDNPFPKRGTRSVGMTRGLVASAPAEGVFTLYSAGLGQQALDRLPGNDPDPNSVFTRVFVREIAKPGQNLIDLGENVRDAVSALAETARLTQIPAYYNEVRGARSIVFADNGGAGASAAARPEREAIVVKPPAPAPLPDPPKPPAPRQAAIEPPRTPPSAARYSYLVGLDPRGDNWLALRSGPNGTGSRLMKMGPETLLTVLHRQGKWNYVQLRTGETGWAHGDYIACCRSASPR